jgi:hypothetical protein
MMKTIGLMIRKAIMSSLYQVAEWPRKLAAKALLSVVTIDFYAHIRSIKMKKAVRRWARFIV